MEPVPNPNRPTGRGQRSWTDAQRAEQARKIRDHQVWLKSTGPTTAQGKLTSSRNSYKHGRFSWEKQFLRWYLRLSILRVKQLKTHLNYQNYKRENELLNKYGTPKPPHPDIMAFYPYFKVHPMYAKPKRVSQPRQKSENQEIFDFLTSHSGD